MNTPARSLAPLRRGSLFSRPWSSAARQSITFTRTFTYTRQPIVRSKPTVQPCQQNVLLSLRGRCTAGPPRSLRFKSHKSHPKSTQSPDPTPHLGSPEPALSLSQRLRKLGRQYGWLALGVYMGLAVLDFPLCFLTVRMLGTDRIGHYEHVIVEGVKNMLRIPFPNLWKDSDPSLADEVQEATAREGSVGNNVAKETAEASIWTQLALAYAVHKALIFIRIPLTAALLPKVAKTLRGFGYNVGRAKPKK
ncbi:peptide alpha-N-acetyltransferas-like protein Nat2 [Massarina eburnea CBS 473.64]|uniref:Peptide alpha-N-acetyltransferas-like protein Nat2 n=1 Tax=Massarina eburnea CBS 473.64 TaxID=1395130 RepID=A0A6A6RJ89_9PLEO|nr:peptide alpha-N-acetyltransferas-like protein Nat2 [Massarina eburnea CBS 473.64]